MPESGSQVILCDLPVRFDTYNGCTHACTYCFARKKRDIERVGYHESPEALERWIEGARTQDTCWCDWTIPLHWGGMSDPFQPAEREHGRSLACLRVFARTGYPVVISTKGTLLTEPPYLDVLRECNAAVQVSLVSPRFDKLEPGAPSYAERLRALPTLAGAARRLIVRVQPYALGLVDDVCNALLGWKAAGVHGIVVEGMKRSSKRPGLVKVGGDWCYPVVALRRELEAIKARCREVGLRFYAGENRLRSLGDDPCCCGVADLPGWEVNRSNLNHLRDPGGITYRPRMQEPGTASLFRSIAQTTILGAAVKRMSFRDAMTIASRSRSLLSALGYLPGP